ncbi:hypothetical protein [Embleya sp. MST-111070]|uniref:hypothetical protein n=1 Tax=Embleya sp. MST-111070 TaxID=3398231 RepID=UPI003F737447
MFGPGAEIAEVLRRLRSADAATTLEVIRGLWGSVCYAGQSSAAGVLAVPFVLRPAADRSAHHRSEMLWLAGRIARGRDNRGFGREDLLMAGYPQDEWAFDAAGYLQNWTIDAARAAITADARIVVACPSAP